jgi:hypothetical protein
VRFSRLRLALGFLVVFCTTARAFDPAELPGLTRKWRYYQSANFELYSAQSDSESRDVLEHMELLRAVFLDNFKLTVRQPQPVTIYYFDRDKDFTSYLPQHLRGGSARYKGICSGYADRTVIKLAPVQTDDSARELVYHEYIHYLFRLAELRPAPWFNEGVAELYSTMEEKKDWLILGNPVIGRVHQLKNGRLMPFEKLFATRRDSQIFRESDHTGIFYAQSWIFLHYCVFGVNKIPDEQLSLFLRVAGSPKIQERPEEFRAICKELLGHDYPELLRQMDRYLSTGKFVGRKVPRPLIAPRSEYLSRIAGTEEMTALLAELRFRQTESVFVDSFLRDLLARNESVRLHEVLGTMAMKRREYPLAREHWGRAVELGTINAAIFRELGRLEANSVFGKFDLDLRLSEEETGRLRHLLTRSLEFAPEQVQGYEMLAWVEATAGKPDIASLNRIQRRFPTLEDKARTLLALVIARMNLGAKDDALKLLGELEFLDASDWVLYAAEVTRARLEKRPVDYKRLPNPAFNRSGGISIIPPELQLPP